MSSLSISAADVSPLSLLTRVREHYSRNEVAQKLDVVYRTVMRWERGESVLPTRLIPALEGLLPRDSLNAQETKEFRTIDMFAGIGGVRLGFEENGGTCVFTSEWDKYAKKTYIENFGEGHEFAGDITQIAAADVPDHDVLLGGFPCQPFSIAGVSKKNSLGRAHGFLDLTQGTLFFDVARIIKEKRPASFMLENVKNLLRHDKGETFKTILSVLREELGYEVHYRVINGAHFTPQNRERIIIVGFREQTSFNFDELELPDLANRPRMSQVLHRTDGTEPYLAWDGDRFFDHDRHVVHDKYTLTPNLWVYLQAYAAKHKAAGHGFGFGLTDANGTSRTLSARYHKDGSEILIDQPGHPTGRPRRLTPRECARLMGYRDEFRIPVSDTQGYRQFGNSVVVPVISAVAAHMKPHILGITEAR